MEIILQGKDADDWIYRGEGAANLVLGYSGSSPAFVQKAPTKGWGTISIDTVLTSDERLIWKDLRDLVLSPSKEILSQLFVQLIVSPLLGCEHVDAGVHIQVSKEFLKLIENKIVVQRPIWRVDAAKVDTYCDSAMLISDHSLLPHGLGTEEHCIAVEIKISQISLYDPLDLFSGSRENIQRAVRTLLTTPQNNFRVFLDGILIYGGSGGYSEADCSLIDTCEKSKRLAETLNGAIKCGRNDMISCLVELIADTLYQSRVLNKLLEVQKLDLFDIEGAIHAYYDIISQPCRICKNSDDADMVNQCSFFHSLPLEESIKIVREYLISATAKDCSLMISFKNSHWNLKRWIRFYPSGFN